MLIKDSQDLRYDSILEANRDKLATSRTGFERKEPIKIKIKINWYS